MARHKEVHPAANIFPMMDDASYERLKADIEQNGLKEPLVYYKQQLLDGRNRLRACQELGLEPAECELDEDQEPTSFVISSNLHRRHLKPSQKAMCAGRVATLPRGNPNSKSANLRIYTVEQASELFGVAQRAIEYARKVLREGCAELIALCDAGKSVATACKFIDECDGKRQQSSIAKDGWKAIQDHVKAHEEVTPGKSSPTQKPQESLPLPEEAPEEVVAEVEAWLERQDDRPFFERFKTLWNAADDTGKSAIRAFILGEE